MQIDARKGQEAKPDKPIRWKLKGRISLGGLPEGVENPANQRAQAAARESAFANQHKYELFAPNNAKLGWKSSCGDRNGVCDDRIADMWLPWFRYGLATYQWTVKILVAVVR